MKVAAAIALLVVLGVLALRATSKTAGTEQLVHRGAPVFNVLLTPGKVKHVAARPGELMRLESRADGFSATTTYTRFTLPAFRGNVSGVLPIYATRDVNPDVVIAEGKARVNDAPGYQVLLRGAGGATTRRVYVVPADTGERDGVLITFEQSGKGPKPIVTAAKKAFRSFRFGTERG